MLQQRSPRQPTQRSPLVQGDMVGLVALDLILRLVRARVMDIALVAGQGHHRAVVSKKLPAGEDRRGQTAF